LGPPLGLTVRDDNLSYGNCRLSVYLFPSKCVDAMLTREQSGAANVMWEIINTRAFFGRGMEWGVNPLRFIFFVC
jgi:hypothetical protein